MPLQPRVNGVSLGRWLLDELRRAIQSGSLKPGTRLPASRDIAGQYGISRGTVVTVFEQLRMDGYLVTQTGAGSWVNHRLPVKREAPRIRHEARQALPSPMAGLQVQPSARPFRMWEPSLAEFPFHIWNRIAGRRARNAAAVGSAGEDLRGFSGLRHAIAEYLGASRSVNCEPGQIVITSGVQQALDLLSRLLLKPGEPVWMEDPGYFGAILAFRNARARIIPVPVDDFGLKVDIGKRRCASARHAYVTPAHQFPLGAAMSMDRRLDLLAWARHSRAYVIEDDYDSEFRFEGRPTPTLRGIDSENNVILVGTFNKLLFRSIALGYVVLPPALLDPFLGLRYATDLGTVSFQQAVLAEFIYEGHLGRHLRRMREIYGARLDALLDEGRKQLKGLMEMSPTQAGLYTCGFLRNGMDSQAAETAATTAGVECMGLHRFTLKQPDPKGLLLGFAAFDEATIRKGVHDLASALEPPRCNSAKVPERTHYPK